MWNLMKILYIYGITPSQLSFILSTLKLSFKIGVLFTARKVSQEFPKDLPILIDNGAYIEGKSLLSIEELVKIYENAKRYYDNVKVIMPDVVEDYIKTYQYYEQVLKYIIDNNMIHYLPDFVFVIQGKSINEYLLCFKYLINTFKKYRCKGVSIKHVIIGIGGIKKKSIHERSIVVETVAKHVHDYFRRTFGVRAKIHVFGADVKTIEKTHTYVYSFDEATHRFDVNVKGFIRVKIVKEDGKFYEPQIYVKDLENNSKIDYEALQFHNLREYLVRVQLIVNGSKLSR